jgi:subtilase family serine protease
MPMDIRGVPILFLTFCLSPFLTQGQEVADRITAAIDSNSVVALAGSGNPRAAAQNDAGRVASGTKVSGITMYFMLSAVQKQELDTLVKAQQTPSSAQYHKWITPDEYASRFGLSDNDVAKVQSWLEQQGFTVDGVARSRSSISFSGTVGQVESAFGTEAHNYKLGNETHFANATQLMIPSALSGVVRSVRNLDNFRPKPFVRFHPSRAGGAKPAFTSSESGDHYLQPGDVAVIYDIKAAYSASYTGAGQSIAVVGQSEINLSDIENFQSAAGLTVKDPTLVLVPDSGSAAYYTGDEAESDLDLEYSGGIAKGATIYLVYTGDNTNYNVWDSLQYAVDTDIAPIISMSYGGCEPDLSSSDYSTLESIMEQGASQGQSIIVASGDTGSTACYADLTTNSTPTSEEEELAVNYPASSAYATALGGTEFPSGDVSSSNTTYWDSASGSDVVTSAKSYIPEQVWNDDSSTYGSQDGAEYALGAGGGGTSTLTARPSWQTGVTGISSGSYRLVPDISLDSSPNNAGYLYCSSDTSGWSSGQEASCNSGFRDSSTDYLTVAGGTSFAAPIFAGMLAIINQKENSTGQGLINSTLYTLAANSSAYASAFHDITSGGNECTAGSSYCSSAGESKYYAGTGYDEASGLGSVDLYNLMTSWTGGSSASLDATTTSLSAASSTPSSGASDTITITVSPESSSITTTPTGTLTVTADGTTESSSLALSNGSATYTFSSSTSGAHVITAKYSGDSKFASSTGTVTVDVGGTSGTSSTSSFALSATNMTVSQGSSGTSTVTITPQNSYAGTISFSLSTGSTSLLDYGCYSIGNSSGDVSVTANTATTTALTIYTSESDCSSTSSSQRRSGVRFFTPRKNIAAGADKTPFSRRMFPVSVAIAGALLFGMRSRRKKLSDLLSLFIVFVVLGSALGCGSSSSSSSTSTSTDVAKGTYSLTLDGTDTSNSSIADSTSLTLTVN